MRLHSLRLLMGLLFLMGFAGVASGQTLSSNTASVTLTATLSESLTVSATPTTVTFALTPGGTAMGNSPVSVTTTWNTSTAEGHIELDGYFSSATAALTSSNQSPATNIPTSAVLGQMATGSPTSFTAFTSSAGNVAGATAGATLPLFNVALSSANRSVTRTDSLALEINLSSLPQIPADTYMGTLYLKAEAY